MCDSLEMLGKKSDNSDSIAENTGGATPPVQDAPDDDLPF
jgi:hypothetical protein